MTKIERCISFLNETDYKEPTKNENESEKRRRTSQAERDMDRIRDESTPFGYSTFNRIENFLSGQLDEELAWTEGLVIKLDTYNHTKSIEKLSIILNQWYKILRAFGRVNGENESDYQIHNLKIGSLIITVTTVAGVVITLGKAINYVLDAVKKSYEIKKHAVELKKLQSENIKDVTKALEEAAKINAEKESEKIANQLILNINYTADDKNEVATSLKKAISFLFKFYDEGGETKLLMSVSFP